MAFTTKVFTLLLLVFSALSVNGFVAPSGTKSLNQQIHTAASTRSTTTALSERQWNFNEGQGPWGMKKNAEIWNGRVAQVIFFQCFNFIIVRSDSSTLHSYTFFFVCFRINVQDGFCLDFFARVDLWKGCHSGYPRRKLVFRCKCRYLRSLCCWTYRMASAQG